MADITTVGGYEKPIGGEKYSRAMVNRNLDRNERDLVESRKDAKGLLWQSHVTTSSGVVGDAIINNIGEFTFKANRKYRIIWDFSYIMTGDGSLFYCSIGFAPVGDAAASLANITVLEGRTKGILTGKGNMTQHTGPVTAYHRQGATDSSHQIKFRLQRVVGGDGMVVVGQANERAIYSIYDDGEQNALIY